MLFWTPGVTNEQNTRTATPTQTSSQPPGKGDIEDYFLPVTGDGENIDQMLVDAARTGNTAIIDILIHNTNDVNGDTVSPLLLAVENGHIEIVRLLLEHPKIDVNKKKGKDSNTFHAVVIKTPLLLAVENDHTEIVRFLNIQISM
jgi:ankyrin repeat protein